MRVINEDIKNSAFKSIYLMYGEEAYLKRQMKDKLKQALVADDDTMNYSYFEGKKVDFAEVMELASTLPFFSEYRLIVLEETNLFKGTPDNFIKSLGELPDTTILIFVETDMDKRSKLYKAINKNGYVANLSGLDEKSLIQWITVLLKQEGKGMTSQTVHYFLEKTGMNMDNVKNELEKLFSYTKDREVITTADVDEVTTTVTTSKIFDMMAFIANKKKKPALDLYYDLLTLKEPPMRILALLSRQFNLVMQVKDLERLGFRNQEIGKKVGLAPFIVNKYLNQGKHFTLERLKEMLAECAGTEEAVKTGRLNDVVGVEMLIISFSS